MDNHVSSSTSSESGTVGSKVLVKVGRQTVEAIVLDVLNTGWRVKSITTGKKFKTSSIVTLLTPPAEEAPVAEAPAEPATVEAAPVEDAAQSTEPGAAEEAAPRVKKRSLIEAAAAVLKESSEPMNTRSLVKAAVERGLWTPTNCKTPEQSLYGAIFREIKVSSTPRFRKSATRGAFEYVS